MYEKDKFEIKNSSLNWKNYRERERERERIELQDQLKKDKRFR